MFDRSRERAEILHHLTLGRSILMLAPRRVGKTWLINRVAEDVRADGWMAVSCDVEGMSREAEFLQEICRRIEEQEGLAGKAEGRARHLLNQLFSRDLADGWQEALGRMDWISFAETLVRGLHERGRNTLILVDELALFLAARLRDDAQGARAFLYGLRRLQQRYSRVRWLFTGSIGLDAIAKRGEIGGALVDLTLYPLEPFGRDAARAFLDFLSTTQATLTPFLLDDAGFDHFARQLGWLSPYYLDHVAREIRPSGPPGPDGRPLATTRDVDNAFEAMLAARRRPYFVTWEEHLSKNFPRPDADALRSILAACARNPAGERLDTLRARLGGPPHGLDGRALRDLLTILANDGYLAEAPDGEEARFRFRSGLLRRYWLRYHMDADR